MKLHDLPLMACSAALEFDHGGVVGGATRLLIERLAQFDTSDPMEALRFARFFEDIGQKTEKLTLDELNVVMKALVARLRAALLAA